MSNKVKVSGFLPFQVRVNGPFKYGYKILSKHRTREEGRAEVERLKALGHPAFLVWYC